MTWRAGGCGAGGASLLAGDDLRAFFDRGLVVAGVSVTAVGFLVVLAPVS